MQYSTPCRRAVLQIEGKTRLFSYYILLNRALTNFLGKKGGRSQDEVDYTTSFFYHSPVACSSKLGLIPRKVGVLKLGWGQNPHSNSSQLRLFPLPYSFGLTNAF